MNSVEQQLRHQLAESEKTISLLEDALRGELVEWAKTKPIPEIISIASSLICAAAERNGKQKDLSA